MKLLKKKDISTCLLSIILLASCTNLKQADNKQKNLLTFDTVELGNKDETSLKIEEIDITKSGEKLAQENTETSNIAVVFGPGLYRSFRSINFLKSLHENKSLQVGMFCGVEFGAIVAYMASEGWRPEKMEWFLFGLSKILKNTTPYKSDWKKILRDYLSKNLLNNSKGLNFCFTYNDTEKNKEEINFGKDQSQIFFSAVGISDDKKIGTPKRIDEGLIDGLSEKHFMNIIFVDTIGPKIDFNINIDRSFYSGFYGRYKSDSLRLKKSIKLYVDISEGDGPLDEFPDLLGDLNKDLIIKSKKYLSSFLLMDLSSGDDNESNF